MRVNRTGFAVIRNEAHDKIYEATDGATFCESIDDGSKWENSHILLRHARISHTEIRKKKTKKKSCLRAIKTEAGN